MIDPALGKAVAEAAERAVGAIVRGAEVAEKDIRKAPAGYAATSGW